MTGDDDVQVIPPLEAFWAGARTADPSRLWFRGYQGKGRDRPLAGPVDEVPTRASVDWVGSEWAAGRVQGPPR